MKFVKNKKIKTFLSLVTALSLIFSVASTVSAQSVPTTITSNTIVTNDNINQVLNYLGIDSSKVSKFKETGNKADITYTVQDLENMNQEAKQPSTLISQSINNNANISTTNSTVTSSATGSKTVSETDAFTNFWLTYSFTAYYNGSLFTSPYGKNPTVAITVSPLTAGVSISIDSITNDTLSPSASLIYQYSTVNVGHYITIGVAGIGYTFEAYVDTMTSTHSYYASQWL